MTADVGGSRSDAGYAGDAVSTLGLDPTAFPNAAAMKGNAQLGGRLTVMRATGDTDGDGDLDASTSPPGSRGHVASGQGGGQSPAMSAPDGWKAPRPVS